MAARTHEMACSHRLRLFLSRLFYSHVAAFDDWSHSKLIFSFSFKENFKMLDHLTG